MHIDLLTNEMRGNDDAMKTNAGTKKPYEKILNSKIKFIGLGISFANVD